MRTALRRRPAIVLPALLLTALALALGACAGDGGREDATALLERAFDRPVPSASVDIDLQVDVDGANGLEGPLRIGAEGSYVRADRKLPKLDLDLEIATGAGQAIRSGILSTGDRVFLEFGGTHYEQPRAQVARANRRLAREGGGDSGSLGDLGLDPREWIVDASIEGEEEIGGVATDHVTGTLDVAAALEDLNGLLERSTDAAGGSSPGPQPLSESDLDRLARSVDDPSFDVYVGRDDEIVRRISLRLAIAVPEEDRDDVGGVAGASLRLAAELTDVGGDQEVTAPRESRPIAELTRQLGGLEALAGAAGLDGAAGGAAPDPGAPAEEPGSGSAADAFERYGECLERAGAGDAEAIQRCSELLR